MQPPRLRALSALRPMKPSVIAYALLLLTIGVVPASAQDVARQQDSDFAPS